MLLNLPDAEGLDNLPAGIPLLPGNNISTARLYSITVEYMSAASDAPAELMC
jgi:hypothetical protein